MEVQDFSPHCNFSGIEQVAAPEFLRLAEPVGVDVQAAASPSEYADPNGAFVLIRHEVLQIGFQERFVSFYLAQSRGCVKIFDFPDLAGILWREPKVSILLTG